MTWSRISAADGLEIAYTERGSGTPVVLVPGFTMSGEVFEHQLTGLGPRYRVITFDPRSHGRSTATSSGNSYPQQGRDLLALIDVLGITDVHLVGWSYGALACYAAIREAGIDGFASMTALDQTPKPLASGEEGEWAEMDLESFLDEMVGPVVASSEQFAAELVEWMSGGSLSASERRWLEAMHVATSRPAAASLIVSAMLCDDRDVVRRIDGAIPHANVLWSDWLSEAQPWLSANAPHGVIWEIPSHLGFWQRPEDFNERLITFLETGA